MNPYKRQNSLFRMVKKWCFPHILSLVCILMNTQKVGQRCGDVAFHNGESSDFLSTFAGSCWVHTNLLLMAKLRYCICPAKYQNSLLVYTYTSIQSYTSYIYVCMYVYIYTHMFLWFCIHTYMHACMHTYIHTYRQTDIHSYIHSYIHTYTYIYIYIRCICNHLYYVYWLYIYIHMWL